MKKMLVLPVLAAMASLGSPVAAAGQEEGGGGFLDWIHRLSGPGMMGPGVSLFWQGETIRLRVAGAYLVPLNDDKIDPDHTFNMVSLRPSVEVPVWSPFEISAGADLHRFGGEGHDAVVKLSVPVYGQLRVPLGLRGNWFLRVALGGRYFPSFDPDDFDGAISGLKTDGGEVSLGGMLGLDYVRR
jgi:hypothetical protein